MKFILNINGKDTEIEASSDKRLSEIIRSDLGKKGMKSGCNCGNCGYCVVLLDDEPVYSCLIPVFSAQNRSIITIEGIAQKSEINNITQGLKLAGVNLCPACAPARMLSIYSLITSRHSVSDEDIEETVLSTNCRCTDFKTLKEGIFFAAGMITRTEND